MSWSSSNTPLAGPFEFSGPGGVGLNLKYQEHVPASHPTRFPESQRQVREALNFVATADELTAPSIRYTSI